MKKILFIFTLILSLFVVASCQSKTRATDVSSYSVVEKEEQLATFRSEFVKANEKEKYFNKNSQESFRYSVDGNLNLDVDTSVDKISTVFNISSKFKLPSTEYLLP